MAKHKGRAGKNKAGVSKQGQTYNSSVGKIRLVFAKHKSSVRKNNAGVYSRFMDSLLFETGVVFSVFSGRWVTSENCDTVIL